MGREKIAKINLFFASGSRAVVVESMHDTELRV
jgi:hypothetical protein